MADVDSRTSRLAVCGSAYWIGEYYSTFSLAKLAKRAWAAVHGARTLVVGRRLRCTSFDVGDGREVELQLVPRIDHG